MVVLAIVASSQCSKNAGGNSASFIDSNVSNGIAAQAPPPPQALAITAVNRGVVHLRLAMTAEGFSGAMIYSQNCYDALARQFSWARLDTCGALDMLAARSIADADTASLASEAGYFQSEAAAGRYLSAATAAGEPAEDADERLSQLQARVGRVSTVGQRSSEATEIPLNNTATSQIETPGRRDSLAQCVRGAFGPLPSSADPTMLCTCATEKISGGISQREAISQCAAEVEAEFPDGDA